MRRGLPASQTRRAYEQAAVHDEQSVQEHGRHMKTPTTIRISTSARTIFSADLLAPGLVFAHRAKNPKCTTVSISQASSIASLYIQL